ncbi:acyl carrier protein [Aureimonas pseudogalii]|uniref:Acyl carrier protein n=1 Tax=Aureimonas pseudogalii TaxID=1744844 RepID=A0A7W6EF53_9HYPH|nr:acyl carrier protein [Aureimonas pseudogalii]MBB3996734.1 acyl carrier protein [Aureimonas pseudogalii]
MPPHPRDDLAEYFATLLRVSRGAISTSANVLDLGADSIMLLEARGWIESRYGRRIEIRQFFEELNTIDAIAAFLAETGAEASTWSDSGAPPPVARESILQRPGAALAGAGSADIRLMRAQLAMVAEVIEAQNRLAATLRGRIEAQPTPEPPQAAGPAGQRGAPRRPAGATAIQETEVTPA